MESSVTDDLKAGFAGDMMPAACFLYDFTSV